jgi:hypothetical protein
LTHSGHELQDTEGHETWIDRERIKAGDNWRRTILDGVRLSDITLAFLSRHSTRDPGVCLDELAIALHWSGGNIATVLVESEQEVRPPVSVGACAMVGYALLARMSVWRKQSQLFLEVTT